MSLQLSVELTKLIPMAGVAAWKAAEAMLSLARSLQVSGSDIVIEADLAEMFGRSLIEPQMASTFKSVIAKNSRSKLCDGISLESGPGPTTTRALKPEQAIYFSTVIQCSLLAYVLQKDDLAATLKIFFDKIADSTVRDQQMRASPSAEGIAGFLQVCQDQTAEYDWSMSLLAVSRYLGLSDPESCETIPNSILEGLIPSLTMVQRFPEARSIQIESSSGVCLIVVWAHLVLGLSVTVKQHGDPQQTVVFGTEKPHIIIDTCYFRKNVIVEPSFTLLGYTKDNSSEPEFEIRPDPDELKIESVYRVPAKGYGSRVLGDYLKGRNGVSGPFEPELANVTCAFAIIIAENLRAWRRAPFQPQVKVSRQKTLDKDDDSDQEDSTGTTVSSDEEHCPVDISQIMTASHFIFESKLSPASIDEYAALYRGRPLDRDLERPRTMSVWYKTQETPQPQAPWDAQWNAIVELARHLSVLILTFCHIQDLPSCAKMMLNHNHRILGSHNLVEQLRDWDGENGLKITEFTWFYAITTLLLDPRDTDRDGAALLSNRGWSIYLSTFGLQSPFDVEAGHLIIRKGTPYRNGMYRHAVIDGWEKGGEEQCDWQRVDSAGAQTTLSCANKVFLGRAIYGEHRDAFVVSLRLNYELADYKCTRRAGYRELCAALWMVQKTKSCSHSTRSMVTLTPGIVTLSGFNDLELPDYNERIQVCLTANQDFARWRVLLAIVSARINLGQKQEYVMLRGNDCCLQCALDQASLSTEQCILVL